MRKGSQFDCHLYAQRPSHKCVDDMKSCPLMIDAAHLATTYHGVPIVQFVEDETKG